VAVSEDIIQQMREQYANPDHPVLRLVPHDFDVVMRLSMEAIGNPPIHRDSFWDVYCQLLGQLDVAAIDLDDMAAQDQRFDEEEFEDGEGLPRMAEQLDRTPVGVVDGGNHEQLRAVGAFVDDEGRVWIGNLGEESDDEED
jgi:hypothetical protein